MDRKLKVLFSLILFIIITSTSLTKVYALILDCTNQPSTCDQTSQCQFECNGSPSCTASCVDYQPGIKCGKCKWTVGNTCTKDSTWINVGTCALDTHCQEQKCENGHDYDLQLVSCGGGTCGQTGGGPSCPNGPYVDVCRFNCITRFLSEQSKIITQERRNDIRRETGKAAFECSGIG